MDWPLRAKMVVLLVVASLLPLMIVTLIDIRGARERLLTNAGAVLSARGDHLSDQLDAFHLSYQRSVNRFAHLPGTVGFFQASSEEVGRLGPEMHSTMEVWPASDPDIRGIALLDMSGKVKFATEDQLVGADLSYRSFVQEALREKGIVISDIYFADRSENYAPTIAYLAPVTGPEQKVIGLVAFWVRASALGKVMRASNELAGPGSFAVLFDHHGIRIAHTYSDDIVFHPAGQLDSATLKALVAERRFGERTQALLEDVRAFPEQFALSRAEAPDKDIFRGFAPVNQKWNYGVGRRFTTVPWTVFYMVPEQSFDAQIADMTRQKVIFAAVIIFLALFAGTWFVAAILKPVRALSKTTAAIAAGDLAARVAATHQDELGRLGASFNTMAERIENQATALQKSRDHLETRVKERTAELERTTKELQAENAERKQAERAMRESRQLLEAIVDNSAAVIYVKDLQGRYLLINRRYEEIFNLTRDAIIGKSDHELFSKEAADAFRKVDQRVAAGDSALTEEELVPLADGLHTFISVKCPLRDADGKTYGIFGISTDITESKRAQEALAASERHYRLIFEQSPLPKWIYDPVSLRFLAVNEAAQTHYGYSAAEFLAMTIQDIRPSEDVPALRADVAYARENSRRASEWRHLKRDGTAIDVIIHAHDIVLSGQRARLVVAQDITERKQAESKVQAQLDRLNLLNRITRAIAERQDLPSIFQVVIRSVEESLPVDFCCMCLYDPADEVITVSSVGIQSEALAMELAMTEHARIEIDENGLSRCVRGQLVYEPDVSEVTFPFPQRLARGGLHALVAAPLLVESKVFGLLIAARREARSFGSGECEFLKQVTEHVALASHQAQLYDALQQAYQDLRRSQQAMMQQERLRALGEMASGIAHDINNAISPVSLYTESLLEREPNLSPKGREYLKTIQHCVDDVAQTVRRMREFYRQREPQLTLTPVNLNQLANQVAELTRARWSDMPQQRGVEIELRRELADDLPPVMAVESEIREALINLIFNAVDAMADGGALTLRTRRIERSTGDGRRSQVELQVEDTGVGMSEDTRQRCLEPFFTTKGERGTGLGLAMVYGIVQRHSAEIEIESALGKGTTISLRFAIPSSEIIDSAPPSFQDPKPSRRLRLLVIDDDPLIIKSLRDTLERDGHEIVAAMGGQEGITAFSSGLETGKPFDAVITDLGMPRVDGRQVASAIKAASATTPVILLTGWGQRLVAEGEVPPHVDRVLNKPPKLRELRGALADVTA